MLSKKVFPNLPNYIKYKIYFMNNKRLFVIILQINWFQILLIRLILTDLKQILLLFLLFFDDFL